MKNLNLISILLGIVIGIAATFLITKFFFPEKNYSALPGVKEQNVTEKSDAEKYIETNKLNIDRDTCVYKYAINVSKEQYELLKNTVGNMSQQQLNAISGFRLYFAYLPPNNSLVSLAYTIDNRFMQMPPQGNVLVSRPYNLIYAQECPPFCN
jgi:hypothetical protein